MDTLRMRIQAMRRQEPYGKDVFSACGVIVNGAAQRRNLARQNETIALAEKAYKDMSLICKPARLLYTKYNAPLPLVVAAIYTGCGQDGGKGASFARAVDNGNTAFLCPRTWPDVLAQWLESHTPDTAKDWDRNILYRAIQNCARAKEHQADVTDIDDKGFVVINEQKQTPEPDQKDAEAHVKSCIDRCATLMTELYVVLKQISGAVPETSAGNVCVSRQ